MIQKGLFCVCLIETEHITLTFLLPCFSFINSVLVETVLVSTSKTYFFFFLVYTASPNPDKKAEESYYQRLSAQILGDQAKATAPKYFRFLKI